MKTKLIPPDKKQCQADVKTGCWPDARNFMAIGPAKLERCKNVPTVIIRENRDAEDGQRGSMSLCAGCLKSALEQYGPAFFAVMKLKRSGK